MHIVNKPGVHGVPLQQEPKHAFKVHYIFKMNVNLKSTRMKIVNLYFRKCVASHYSGQGTHAKKYHHGQELLRARYIQITLHFNTFFNVWLNDS